MEPEASTLQPENPAIKLCPETIEILPSQLKAQSV
jgi:hypothetical protein